MTKTEEYPAKAHEMCEFETECMLSTSEEELRLFYQNKSKKITRAVTIVKLVCVEALLIRSKNGDLKKIKAGLEGKSPPMTCIILIFFIE